MGDSTPSGSPPLSVKTDSSTTMTASSSMAHEGSAKASSITTDISPESIYRKTSSGKTVTFAEPVRQVNLRSGSASVDTDEKKDLQLDPFVSRGKPFTSDVGISRCIEMNGVPVDEVCRILTGSGHETISTWVPELGKHLVMVYLNDSRAAEAIVQEIPRRFAGSKCNFVSPEAIVPVLDHIKAPLAMSTYNGQLTLTASWIGDREKADFRDVSDKCHDLTRSYGPVRSFALLNHTTHSADFRVEFYKLTSIDEMLRSTGIACQHSITPNINVSVAYYSREGPSSHPPSSANSYLSVSETGRTALENGRPIPGPGFHGLPYQLPQNEFAYQFPSGIGFPEAYSGMNFMGGSQTMVPYHAGGFPFDNQPGIMHARHRSSQSHNSQGAIFYNARGTGFRGAQYGGGRRGRRQNSDCPHPGQSVEAAAIENGADVRTTLMLRNLPNRLTFWDVKNVLESTSKGVIDFLYVRVDFGSGLNVGYGFVNFIAPEYIVPFLKTSVGKPWPGFESNKVLEVSYATIQGQECLIQKFRNSSVLRECEGYVPKLFYTIADNEIPEGKQIGDEYKFPSPDNQQKLNRSLDNARTVGLFTAKDSRGSRDARRPRSQFDRGTPRAVHDEAIAAARGIGHTRSHSSVGIIGHGPAMGNQGMQGAMIRQGDLGPITPPPPPPQFNLRSRLDPRVPGFCPDPFQAYYNFQTPGTTPGYGTPSNQAGVSFGSQYSPEGYHNLSPTPRGRYTW